VGRASQPSRKTSRNLRLEEREDRRLGRRSDEPVPIGVKELRRACLKALAVPATSREEKRTQRRDLNSLFVAIQFFTYFGASSHSPDCKYWSIDAAALRPAPMARITVAAPVTMSPPAKTPRFDVFSVSGSAAM